MRTEAQNLASRTNGAKSRGPVTEAGKAVSSRNSLRTGIYAEAEIITGENIEDFETLIAEIYAEYQPEIIDEREAADALARGYWNLRRLARADAQLWNENMRRTQRHDGNPNPLGDAINYGDHKAHERLQRRINSIGRTVKDCLKFLKAAKDQRLATKTAPPQPEPAPEVTENKTPAAPLGFVPSKPAQPSPEPEKTPVAAPNPPLSAPRPLPNHAKEDKSY